MINRSKLARAEAVLNLIEGILGDSHKVFFLDTYSNGRETGYSLLNGDAQVAFSENRNSDSTVVYFGKRLNFSMQGNVPNEEVYKNKRFFPYDRTYGAAKFIVNYLCGENDEK